MKVSDLNSANTLESRLLSLQNDLSRSKMQQKRYELQLRNLISTRTKISQSVQQLSTSYQREVKQMQQRIKKLQQQNRKLIKSNNLYKMSIENFEKTILQKDRIISTILGKQLITTTITSTTSKNNRLQQQHQYQQQQATISADRIGEYIQPTTTPTVVKKKNIQQQVINTSNNQSNSISNDRIIENQKKQNDLIECFKPIIEKKETQHSPIMIQEELFVEKQQVSRQQQQAVQQQQVKQQKQQPQQQEREQQQQQLIQATTIQPQLYNQTIHTENNNDFIESVVFHNNSPLMQFKPFEGIDNSQNVGEIIIHDVKPVEEQRGKQLHSGVSELVQEPIPEPTQIKKVIPPPPKAKRVAPPPPAKKPHPPQQQQAPQPIAQVKDTPTVQDQPKIPLFKKPPPPPAGGIKPKTIRQKHIQRYKPFQFQDEQLTQPQHQIQELTFKQHSEEEEHQANDMIHETKIKQSQQITQSINFPIQSISPHQQHQQQRISFDDNATHHYYPKQDSPNYQPNNKIQIQNMSHSSINRSKRGKRQHSKNQPYNIINFDDNDLTKQQPTYNIFGSLENKHDYHQQQQRVNQQYINNNNNYGLSKSELLPTTTTNKQSQKVDHQYQFNFRHEDIQEDHEMHGIVDESSIEQIDDLSMISGSIFPEEQQHIDQSRFLNSEKKRKQSENDKREEISTIMQVVPSKKMSKKKGKRDNVQTISPISFM